MTSGRAFGASVERALSGGGRGPLRHPAARTGFLLIAAALCAFLSYEAVGNQLTSTGLLHEDRVSLASYLDGTASRPFAFRVVTPALVNFAQNVLGLPALLRALPGPLATHLPEWCAAASSDPRPTCDNIAAYVAVAGAYFFGFLMIVCATCLRLFGSDPLTALLGAAFAFLVVNATLLMGLSHLYDFGVLMFAALLIYCLERQWNIAFTLLLPLAFLTKETLVLYGAGFFMVNLGRIGFGRLVAFAAVQLASFVVLHGLVRRQFAGNPGGGHEYYLPDQIVFLTQEITLARLIPMLVVFVLLFYGFARKQIVLRRTCIVFLPWLALAMLFGYKKEVRIAMEVLPLVALLGIDSLVQMVTGRGSAQTGRQPDPVTD